MSFYSKQEKTAISTDLVENGLSTPFWSKDRSIEAESALELILDGGRWSVEVEYNNMRLILSQNIAEYVKSTTQSNLSIDQLDMLCKEVDGLKGLYPIGSSQIFWWPIRGFSHREIAQAIGVKQFERLYCAFENGELSISGFGKTLKELARSHPFLSQLRSDLEEYYSDQMVPPF